MDILEVEKRANSVAEATDMRLCRGNQGGRSSLVLTCVGYGKRRVDKRQRKTERKRKRKSFKCQCPFYIRLKYDEGVVEVTSAILKHNEACKPSKSRCRQVDRSRGIKISNGILHKFADLLEGNPNYRAIRSWMARNKCSYLGSTSTQIRNLVLRVRSAVLSGKIDVTLPEEFNDLPVKSHPEPQPSPSTVSS